VPGRQQGQLQLRTPIKIVGALGAFEFDEFSGNCQRFCAGKLLDCGPLRLSDAQIGPLAVS
jgi:hypothetical protein